MTQSADITVVPTGGSTPVDLADIAAAVQTIPSQSVKIRDFSWSNPTIALTVCKQTGVIEDLNLAVDGNAQTVYQVSNPTYPAPYNESLADGTYGVWTIDVGYLPPGLHTFSVTGSVSGAQDSKQFSV